MVKIKDKLFFALLTIICLVGCTPDYEFKEKEGYTFDYNECVRMIKSSSVSIEEKYLEFLNCEDIDYNINFSLNPIDDKTIEFDPSLSKKINDLSELNKIRQEKYSPHFKLEDNYQRYAYNYMKNKIVPFIEKSNGKYIFTFATSLYEDNSYFSIYGPFNYRVNPIIYNGISAFQLVYAYNEENFDIYKILYLISNNDNFNYNIYFKGTSEDTFKELYFMPQNDNFSSKYIKYFNEDEDIHYFDIEKIRQLLNE